MGSGKVLFVSPVPPLEAPFIALVSENARGHLDCRACDDGGSEGEGSGVVTCSGVVNRLGWI